MEEKNPSPENILIPSDAIAKRVAELGKQISADYADKDLLCVGVLRGAFVFLSDLVRHVTIPVEVEFVRCSSYGKSSVSSGKVEIEFAKNPSPLRGRHVLVVDDILDSGWTLKKVCEDLSARGAATVKTCVLLNKPARRETALKADYRGFEIENHFVLGYGMDFDQKYRNLPHISILGG